MQYPAINRTGCAPFDKQAALHPFRRGDVLSPVQQSLCLSPSRLAFDLPLFPNIRRNLPDWSYEHLEREVAGRRETILYCARHKAARKLASGSEYVVHGYVLTDADDNQVWFGNATGASGRACRNVLLALHGWIDALRDFRARQAEIARADANTADPGFWRAITHASA